VPSPHVKAGLRPPPKGRLTALTRGLGTTVSAPGFRRWPLANSPAGFVPSFSTSAKNYGFRPASTATLSASAGTAPTRRDQHILEIARHGRMGWQKSSGYDVRAKVEAAIGRYKRVIGDALRSRTDKTEATEVAIAAAALNRMLGLGRPNYVRIV
jgi:hypothetical protein